VLPLPPAGPLHLLGLALLCALAGGLAVVERKGAVQLMLSRPLVLAGLLGWALGDAPSGLLLGVPLELLFLGGVNLGGSVPLNETLLCAGMVAALVPAGIALGTGCDPALCALGLWLFYPLAVAGRRLERAAEERNGKLLDLALQRAAAGDPEAASVNLRGLLVPFATAAAICACCALASPLLAWARQHAPERLAVALTGSWHAAQALAVAAAIRAVRDVRAVRLAALSAAAVFAAGALLWVLR
jgi:PTS system mannose-specific IIC component